MSCVQFSATVADGVCVYEQFSDVQCSEFGEQLSGAAVRCSQYNVQTSATSGQGVSLFMNNIQMCSVQRLANSSAVRRCSG
jgi:hypothetical protein